MLSASLCVSLCTGDVRAEQINIHVYSTSKNSLHWRHNDHDDVSNHQPHGCLLNRLFRRRSKKTSKFRVTGLCAGNSPGPVNSLKGSVTRKMFPFDDVIMYAHISSLSFALLWLKTSRINRVASLSRWHSQDYLNANKASVKYMGE